MDAMGWTSHATQVVKLRTRLVDGIMFVALNYSLDFKNRATWHFEAVCEAGSHGLKEVQVLRNVLNQGAGNNSMPILLGPQCTGMRKLPTFTRIGQITGMRNHTFAYIGYHSLLVLSEEMHDWQRLDRCGKNRLWAPYVR